MFLGTIIVVIVLQYSFSLYYGHYGEIKCALEYLLGIIFVTSVLVDTDSGGRLR
jgi:hypothetical protein